MRAEWLSLSALVRKLRLQDARGVLILHAPEGYMDALGALPWRLNSPPDCVVPLSCKRGGITE